MSRAGAPWPRSCDNALSMAILRPSVNQTSRSALAARLLFTIAVVIAAFWLTAPAAAQPQRVVLLHSTGDAPLEEKEELDARISAVLRGMGFHVLSEGAAAHVEEEAVPQTANEMRALAELQGAQWALLPVVHDADEQAFWITFRAGYAPETRVDELDAEVRRIHTDHRLQALLGAILRPEGPGDEGHALAGQDTVGREAEEAAEQAEADAAAEAERQRLAEEEAQREAEEEAARRAAEQAEADAAEAYANRDRYGVADGASMVSAGFGVLGLVKTGEGGNGGALGSLELTYGRGFAAIPGLELRAGLDIFFGASGAFDLHVGAAYMLSLFTFPIHLGAAVEGGLFMPVTGQRKPGGMVRASLLASVNFTGSLYAELSVPAFTWLSNGGGAIGMGASVRLGTRF